MRADHPGRTFRETGIRGMVGAGLILALVGAHRAGAGEAAASAEALTSPARLLAQAAPGGDTGAAGGGPASPAKNTSARAIAPAPGTSFHDCPDCPEMTVLPAGTFSMGAASTPFDRPVHPVTIPKPLAMSRYEITFADWGRCFAAGGCKLRPDDFGWGGGSRPVINVSWFDAKDFVAWLSKATGHVYRLPSEAEWEYAARGGTTTPFAWGSALGTGMANCRDCGLGSARQTLAVGSFPPNRFGLFDMAGNAAEWVEDCWNDTYRGAPRDGTAWLKGACQQRVLRGGSFDATSAYIKPFARFRYDADVRYYANGFRVVRDLP